MVPHEPPGTADENSRSTNDPESTHTSNGDPHTPVGSRRTLNAGDRAVLVELDDLDAALGFFTRLSELQSGEQAIPGVTELLPAARTVLINYLPWRIGHEELIKRLDQVAATPTSSSEGELVEIDVVYDGEDLAEVADLLGTDTDEVVAMHSGSTWTVAFAGFAPGFAYLTGGDPRLDVPRRSSPRTRIPAGSVALAGTFSGVYPRESPGGWQLIGRTPQAMWQIDRDPPALLAPGDRVRFRPIEATAEDGASARPPTTPSQTIASPRTTDTADTESVAAGTRSNAAALVVERPGLHPVLQDEGRPGWGYLGVSASGAVDLPAMHLANRLAGNPSPTAVLELPFGSFAARARGRLVVAVTGAESEIVVERDGRSLPIIDQRPIALDDGDLLRIGVPTSGFRAVLALRGGFDVRPVLGSLATDTLAGLGPARLAAGDVLGVGEIEPVSVGEPVPWPPPSPAELVLPVVLGPRDDWFDTASIARLSGQAWTITEQADRVGVRLSGAAPLERVVEAELPSEGAVTGSIQVPPSGQPMIFLADHPLTGGYPIIGVVRHDALPLLAQARPGVVIRFQVEQSPEERR